MTDAAREGKRYTLLADEIRAELDKGLFRPGERMPTVREMCARKGLSGGTVRQAYGLLRAEGRLTLTPGRGTFVSAPPSAEKSRKARAMEAIDGLFDCLFEMGFSPAEARMFITLRLAQRDAAPSALPVLLVGDCPEALRAAFEGLSEIHGAEITAFLMDDLRNAAAEGLAGFPLVLAPAALAGEISGILGKHARALAPYALAVTNACTLRIARVSQNARVALYAQSETFAHAMRRAVRAALPGAEVFALTAQTKALEDELARATCVLTAPDYPAFAPQSHARALRDFEKTAGDVIPFTCEVDKGSLLHIALRVSDLLRAPRA